MALFEYLCHGVPMLRSLFHGLILSFFPLYVASTPVGVLTPLMIESKPIIDAMTNKNEITINRLTYLKGQLNGQDIVLIQSGMGIANISFITSRLIQDFQPKQLYLLGSSGAMTPRVKKGMVVLGEKVTNVDFGQLTEHGVSFPFRGLLKHPQNNKPQPINFTSSIPVNKKLDSKTIWGNIATSEMLPNSKEQVSLLKQSGYDIVEMEGAGFMQMCWFYDKQCLVIRGVSNNTDEPITIEDVSMSAKAALDVLNQIVS